MLNIHELETRWFYYKLRSFIPHLSIVLSLIIIVVLFLQFYDAKDQKNHIENMPHTPKKELISHDSTPKIIIQPSLEFMNNIKVDSPAYYTHTIKPIINQKKNTNPVEKTIAQGISQKTAAVKTKEIKIQRQNAHDDIKHVIKRFKISNSPALSLFIAKKYYALENYNQSYNYALITNELNNDIEESWIIFAKSLYKLQKKDKAVKMLEKYIATSHSHRAKILLENIKTGKMK